MSARCETAGGIRNGRDAPEVEKQRKTWPLTNENLKQNVRRSKKKAGTARPKPTENQRRREEKSTKKPTKIRKNRRKIGFGRFWALRVVPGRFWIAPERSRDGLQKPNGAARGAKLAVRVAMLATVGAVWNVPGCQLGAHGGQHGGPNSQLGFPNISIWRPETVPRAFRRDPGATRNDPERPKAAETDFSSIFSRFGRFFR